MDLDPVLKRLEIVERQHGEFAQAIGELRDAAIVTAEVQRRQAEIQRMQAEGLATHEIRMRQFDEAIARFGLKLNEFGDKLNGLIGYIDNMPRQKPPQ